jgi:glutamate synthase domain-containing protein 2
MARQIQREIRETSEKAKLDTKQQENQAEILKICLSFKDSMQRSMRNTKSRVESVRGTKENRAQNQWQEKPSQKRSIMPWHSDIN